MTRATPGAAFAVATFGIALFAIMDAVMKGLSLEIGVYNALLWRAIAGIPIAAAPYFWHRPSWPKPATLRLHIRRGVVGTATALLFVGALARMPLAQAIALSFVAPLITVYLAAVLLGEHVDRRSIFASAVGFAGVLTILLGQKQEEASSEVFVGAIMMLCSTVLYAYNVILMRRQSQVAGAIEVSFFHSATMALTLATAAPFLATMPAMALTPLIILGAVLATASIFLLSWAYARAEANYLAPVEYTAFIWGSALGYIIFEEVIGVFTIAGAALITGACLVVVRRKAAPMPNIEGAV